MFDGTVNVTVSPTVCVSWRMTVVALSTVVAVGVMTGKVRNELSPTGLSVCAQVSGAPPPLELMGTHFPAEPHTCPVGQSPEQPVEAGVAGLLEPQLLARTMRRGRTGRRLIRFRFYDG